MISVILLNRNRPTNMHQIISSLRTKDVEIILINNIGKDDFGADRVVIAQWNAGCYIRVLLSCYAKNDWVMFLDDDLCPKEDLLDVALSIAKERPNFITGAYGRDLGTPDHLYSKSPDITHGNCAMVKGRIMIFNKKILENVRIGAGNWTPQWEQGIYNEDLYFSLEVGKGKPVHWVDENISKNLTELSSNGALCERPDHWQVRDEFCKWYLENRL